MPVSYPHRGPLSNTVSYTNEGHVSRAPRSPLPEDKEYLLILSLFEASLEGSYNPWDSWEETSDDDLGRTPCSLLLDDLPDLPDDDPYDLVDDQWPLPCCPTKYKDLATLDQALQTDRVFRCGSNQCLFCAQRNVYPLADAIAFSRPYSLITVLDVPTRWPDIERFTRNVVQSVKRHGQRLDWAYNIERYPSVPGATLQGYVRGWVDQELVSYYSKKNGAGHANLKKLDYGLGTPNFTYIFKSLSLSRLPSRQEATQA
jgi:hypothetical protein